MDRRRGAVLVAVLVALAGCAGGPSGTVRPAALERAGPASSIVVIAQPVPAGTLFSAYARGYAEGAAKGAATGAASGLQVAMQLLAAGAGAGPAGLLIMAPVAGAVLGAGALAGAVIGTTQATPEDVAAIADRLSAALAAGGAPADRVADVVVERAPRLSGHAAQVARPGDDGHASLGAWYGRLHEQGHAAAIEVGVVAVGFVAAPGSGDVISLAVVAESRIVDLANGRVEEARGIVVQSPAHTVADWTGHDGRVAKNELERGLASIGEAIVDDQLLRRERWFGFDAAPREACGPEPTQPDPGWRAVPFSRERSPSPTSVPSVAPLLAWAPLSPGSPPTVRDVRYDLRIWNASDDVVYERTGLDAPRHEVETPLPAHATLTWSVRARHVVDGRLRATPWSAATIPRLYPSPVLLRGLWFSTGNDPAKRTTCHENDLTPCGCLDFVPAANRFAFRTP